MPIRLAQVEMHSSTSLEYRQYLNLGNPKGMICTCTCRYQHITYMYWWGQGHVEVEHYYPHNQFTSYNYFPLVWDEHTHQSKVCDSLLLFQAPTIHVCTSEWLHVAYFNRIVELYIDIKFNSYDIWNCQHPKFSSCSPCWIQLHFYFGSTIVAVLHELHTP